VVFPRINGRAAAQRLSINYEIAKDTTGVPPGKWVLTERGGTAAVRNNVQVGVVSGRTVDDDGFGHFFANGGICVKPLTGSRPERTRYVIRTAPQAPAGSNTAFTAAGRARRINAVGQQPAPTLRIRTREAKGGAPATAALRIRANTYTTINGVTRLHTERTDIDVLNVTENIEVWLGAAARRPASAKQVLPAV
jgi:hypothetical protein